MTPTPRSSAFPASRRFLSAARASAFVALACAPLVALSSAWGTSVAATPASTAAASEATTTTAIAVTATTPTASTPTAITTTALTTTASNADEAPVNGVVLDVDGRRPLADYTVELRVGNRLERITSDAQGHFASSMPVAHGPIVIVPVDNECANPIPTTGGLSLPSVANAPQTREWKGEALEVLVDVGPTFELATAPTQVEGAPIEMAASTARLIATTPGAIDEGTMLTTTVRSDGGARRWVRFAPLPRGVFAKPAGATLAVEQGDGLWRCDVDVTAMLASHGGKVDVAWKPRARWTGVLRGAGQPVPGTWLTLTRFDEHGAIRERRRTRCDDRGRYAFQALEPGQWQLKGSPLRHNDFQSEPRVVAALADSKLNLSLDPVRQLVPMVGKVTGAAVVEGAPAPAGVEIVLRRSGDTLPQDSVKPAWIVEDGHHVAKFAFASVPAGEYTLQLVPPAGDEEHWPTRTLTVAAGPAPALFVRQ